MFYMRAHTRDAIVSLRWLEKRSTMVWYVYGWPPAQWRLLLFTYAFTFTCAGVKIIHTYLPTYLHTYVQASKQVTAKKSDDYYSPL